MTWTKQIRHVLKQDPETPLKQVGECKRGLHLVLGGRGGVGGLWCRWIETMMEAMNPLQSVTDALTDNPHPPQTNQKPGAAPDARRGDRLLEAARRGAQRHPRPAAGPARAQGKKREAVVVAFFLFLMCGVCVCIYLSMCKASKNLWLSFCVYVHLSCISIRVLIFI